LTPSVLWKAPSDCLQVAACTPIVGDNDGNSDNHKNNEILELAGPLV